MSTREKSYDARISDARAYRQSQPVRTQSGARGGRDLTDEHRRAREQDSGQRPDPGIGPGDGPGTASRGGPLGTSTRKRGKSPLMAAFSPVPPGVDTPPYIALLRPANVATALADVLAGSSVAGAMMTPQVCWLLGATACLYAGGVVLNDYFDRDLDARERPERPIPSGRVSPRAARTLGLALLAAGVLLAAGGGKTAAIVAATLAAAVLTYDAWGKRHALVGPVNMGTCRALNLMLGLAILPAALADRWPLAGLPLAYIAGVTLLSRGEVHGGQRPVARLALGLVALVTAAACWLPLTGHAAWPAWGLLLAALFGARVLPPFWRAAAAPSPGAIRQAVRTGVLSLVLLDAVIAAAYADIMNSLAVLATALLAGWLARQFAVT
jgi:UbiA prenyltransferase family